MPVGKRGRPLLYSDFPCIGCGKSSPAPDSSIFSDTAAQFGIQLQKLKRWKHDSVQISKLTWER